MNIRLHIDQVTVEGARLTRREREQLAATLQDELSRLLLRRAGGRRGPRPASQPAWDTRASSPLGTRIARKVLTALPAGTFGRPAPDSPRTTR
jgi:hypothetical protein